MRRTILAAAVAGAIAIACGGVEPVAGSRCRARSASDTSSCQRAGQLTSCQKQTTVDPNSDDTCCYNGALKSGSKESGLAVATQFYVTSPSVGPTDSTTIHGLWPDYCDGTYPQYCSSDSGIPEMTGSQIQALLKKYSPTTLTYMNKYYKSADGNDPSFWEHEYNKHGTCFSTLRPKCQTPTNELNQTTAAVVGYFEEIVERFQNLPTYDWLSEAGITPSSSKTYSLSSIQNALAQRHGGIPYIGCVGGKTIDEFWYFFHTKGPIIGGTYVAIDSTAKSSCNAQVSYPPK